uniref:Uncharacterized protein n=1 Tax=Solanum tuberosum TaxID=4113 RepID=M1DD76_SOLTU
MRPTVVVHDPLMDPQSVGGVPSLGSKIQWSLIPSTTDQYGPWLDLHTVGLRAPPRLVVPFTTREAFMEGAKAKS